MRRFASLAVLLCLATLATAQHIASDSLPLTRAKQPSKEKPTTRSDRGDTIYVVRGLAEKILALQDVRAKAIGAARLASLLWNEDQPYARGLFEKALAITSGGDQSGDLKRRAGLQGTIITLIARRDAEWAKSLIDAAEKHESVRESRTKGAADINTALALIEEDPDVALQFAGRGVKSGFNPALVQFLFNLRKSNEASANQFFLEVLAHLAQQPAIDVRQIHLAGTYLFTAPDRFESDGYVITRVGDILVPNIASIRPGVSASLARAYMETAVGAIWSAINDGDQRQFSYALAYLLLDKSRAIAPHLTPMVEAELAALAAGVPRTLTQESSFKNINPPAASIEERLGNAERKPDQDGRDVAYLDLAFQAWRKGDFRFARTAASRISNQEASSRLSVLIEFGEAARLLTQGAGKANDARVVANKLPQTIERAILLLAISRATFKNGDSTEAKEIVDSTLPAIQSVKDVRRPVLILIAAGQLAGSYPAEAETLFTQAIKDFNSFEASAYSQIAWYQTVEVGPLVERFPLNITNVDFSFDRAFRTAISSDIETSLMKAEQLKSEGLRSQSFVEIARELLENRASEERVIVVGEDGIRKSASKTIMPSYPDDALKQRQQGVAVAELQYNDIGDVTDVKILEAPAPSVGEAVVKAIRQWKFTPSKMADGTPVSIRGKLTFYFQIDEDGNGRVENPKRFK